MIIHSIFPIQFSGTDVYPFIFLLTFSVLAIDLYITLFIYLLCVIVCALCVCVCVCVCVQVYVCVRVYGSSSKRVAILDLSVTSEIHILGILTRRRTAELNSSNTSFIKIHIPLLYHLLGMHSMYTIQV